MRRFSMVDIASKDVIIREATAIGEIKLKPTTIALLKKRKIAKGDAIAAAEVAAVLAAKNTPGILPLCHHIPLTSVGNEHYFGRDTLRVESHVKGQAKTGVEMEALIAASTYLLTIWDMVKQYEKDGKGQYPTTAITQLKVKEKIKRR